MGEAGALLSNSLSSTICCCYALFLSTGAFTQFYSNDSSV